MAIRARIKPVRPDSVAPSISITSPADGITVSSAFQLSYDATDDRRVQRVATIRSGTTIAAYELSSAPWVVSVCTRDLLNSAYSFQGQAFDTKGNSTLSNTIAVYVSNPSPVVAINSHSNWDVVSATTTLTVSTANTDSVRWFVNGTIIGAPLSTAPFKLSLTTSAYSDGAVSVYALAQNANGGETESEHIFVEVLNTGSVSFNQITVMRSDTSGSHWVTPFGIPAEAGDVVNNRKYKLVARYPNSAAGTLYPIQVDNEITSSATGDLKHCAGHVKLPVTYVSGTNVGIGHSGTYTFPTSVDWTTVTGNFATTFTMAISEYQPKIGLLWMNGTPAIGDSFTVSLTDSTGTQSYTQDITTIDYGQGTNTRITAAHAMSRRITGDSAGRWKSMENTPYKITDMPSNNDPRRIFQIAESASWQPHSIGDVHDQNGFEENTCRVTANNYTDRAMGMATIYPVASYGWSAHPYFNLSPLAGGTGGGFPIWARWTAGEPETWTGGFSINRAGRELAFDTVTSPLYGGQVLSYDNRTVAFNINGTTVQQVRGRTSGARGWVSYMTHGTTGKMVLRYVTGTFVDNEIIDALRAGSADTTYGSAQVNGPVVQNKITGSSSGTVADLLDTSTYTGSPAYIRNIVGSGFTVGETITDLMGGSARVASTVNGASTWNFCAGLGDSAGVSTGSIPTLDAAVARTAWTATWNDGTAAPNINPWFNGHQVYQQIRIVPFKNGATTHPHLVARMVVTWDNTGAVIDRQVTVENSKVRANSKAYWYDVTSISNGVTNYISSTLDNYKQLYHHMWTKWRWHQDKAFGLCDPVDFMKAKLIWSWTRYPTRTDASLYKCKTQGLDAWLDHAQVFPKKIYDTRTGYSKSTPNLPLYAGPYKFDRLGGAATEIGVFSAWEQHFWANDSFALKEQFFAMCDNSWSAFPWYMKDDDPLTVSGASWEDATPHPYMRWYWNTVGYSNYLLGSEDAEKRYMYLAQNHGGAVAVYQSGYKKYSMWSGEIAPTFSHAPPHPARSAYLAVPEECFHASVEQYGRTLSASNESTPFNNVPKSGGTAGDADHVMGVTSGQGNRGLSWPWRSMLMSASIMFDRHPRRSIWRRATQDYANHYTLNVQNTWNGFYEIRNTVNSDNWRTVTSMQAGEPWLQGGELPSIANFGLTADGRMYAYLDHFKSAYCTNVAIACHELEVCNLSSTLDLHTGWAKISNDMTDGAWWKLFPLNHFPPVPLKIPPAAIVGTGLEADPNGLMWPTTDFMYIRNSLEAALEVASSVVVAGQTYSAEHNFGYLFGAAPVTVTPGQVDTVDPTGFIKTKAWYGEPNYVMPTFYATVLRGLARTMSPTNAALAQQVVDLIDAAIPGTQRDLLIYSSWSGAADPNPVATNAYFYDWIWSAWATRQPSQVTSDWT